MLYGARHLLLRKARGEVRHFAGKRAVGAEQGTDVVGIGHPDSIAQARGRRNLRTPYLFHITATAPCACDGYVE
ncbi:hypothetical protein GCM10007898_22370 [Dyella flagellata]|uniref:Uncharacterized protein n=1 Tax=Dyella flagellata TaxID=1867833 RepID=A0ABQ5XCH7_9GAMM|nr:hypothetical protein GCM10007898_22370 [Dyella flagellata]